MILDFQLSVSTQIHDALGAWVERVEKDLGPLTPTEKALAQVASVRILSEWEERGLAQAQIDHENKGWPLVLAIVETARKAASKQPLDGTLDS